MIKVCAEGTTFFYVPASSAQRILADESNECREEQLALATSVDTRLAFFSGRPETLLPYWLVWQTSVDLSSLDTEIGKEGANTKIFIGALRTVLLTSRCRSCGSQYRTLCSDAGDPYPENSELHMQKIRSMQIVRCPKCGGIFGLLVAKIVRAL